MHSPFRAPNSRMGILVGWLGWRSHERIGLPFGMCVFTQRLQSSSLLVMTQFLLTDYHILPKKELPLTPWVRLSQLRSNCFFVRRVPWWTLHWGCTSGCWVPFRRVAMLGTLVKDTTLGSATPHPIISWSRALLPQTSLRPNSVMFAESVTRFKQRSRHLNLSPYTWSLRRRTCAAFSGWPPT